MVVKMFRPSVKDKKEKASLHSFNVEILIFCHYPADMSTPADALIAATDKLNDSLSRLTFDSPVALTYNPLAYAGAAYAAYLRTYASHTKHALFLGMNPGPFGMTQTGVPFGEVAAVKNWLHIEAPIGKPPVEHPKRPVLGFDCPRSEVSGRRLWGLFAECYGTAEEFFRTNFVANYCPLVWMSESGANITPDKLSAIDRKPVEEACMDYLEETIRILQPEMLVGVGGYARKQLEQISSRFPGKTFTLGTLLHPSPASPISNKNWPDLPKQQLKDLGLL